MQSRASMTPYESVPAGCVYRLSIYKLILTKRLILIMRTPRFRMTAYEFSVQDAMNYINAFAVAAVAAVLLMSWI